MAPEDIRKIKEAIKARDSAIIAFSGGVDSTTLAALAYEALGERVLAVTLKSPLFPERELEAAVKAARKIGIQHKVLPFSQQEIPHFSENPVNRCYFCKKALLGTLMELSEMLGYRVVMEGTNASEIEGYRPGFQALLEAGEKVYSPFLEFKVTKAEVREMAQALALPVANKPSMSCLATRFPYGQPITPEALAKVEKAEEYLFSSGFSQVRVRVHENLARIEVLPEDFPEFLEKSKSILDYFKELGFDYVTLDLEGYRSGSMDTSL